MTVTTTDERLRERLDAEAVILTEAFPTATIDAQTNTVTIVNHPLPPGWSHSSTDVLFSFPPNYPAGCPDNVCVRPDLRLARGELPANNQGVQVHAGREWLQLSWHIDAADWRPSANPREGSNLVTYLIGALSRFEDVI